LPFIAGMIKPSASSMSFRYPCFLFNYLLLKDKPLSCGSHLNNADICGVLMINNYHILVYYNKMRKLGAISLASFYLMLTTGMFVCLMHCGTEYFFEKPRHEIAKQVPGGHQDAHGKGQAHHQKKPCGKGGDCSCCNQHGNYIIKENINGSFNFQLAVALPVIVYPIPYLQLAPLTGIYHQKASWLNATGPPLFTNRQLYISYQSLLI
jgi:hypothetical protein